MPAYKLHGKCQSGSDVSQTIKTDVLLKRTIFPFVFSSFFPVDI